MGGRDVWVGILEGSELGEYTVGEYIGKGYFSLVFEGEHRQSGNAVALKILNPGKMTDIGEFQSEGKFLTALNKSANVVGLHYTGQSIIELHSNGVKVPVPIYFHALELAEGCLEELLIDDRERVKLAWRQKIRTWRSAIRGVHQMHLKDFVHRDLKSGNCLLFAGRSPRDECKISDLGRSRDLSQPSRLRPEDYFRGRGDMRFAPPEFLWFQGEDDRLHHRAADLYGLGSLLFEIVTGQCITAFALPMRETMMRDGLEDLSKGYRRDLSGLLSHYKGAYLTFEESCPPIIRKEAGDLLRKICHPVPEKRLQQVRLKNRQVHDPGLEWLLRKADILDKLLASEGSRHRRPRKIA